MYTSTSMKNRIDKASQAATNDPVHLLSEAEKDFAERARANQLRLATHLRMHYDFIICGSGSSGSVIARRLAENPDVSVLLIEAGGSDDLPCVMEPTRWAQNLGSVCDWRFQAEPNPHLKGRPLSLSMGKVLGGGSSINVMMWSRGHKNDWTTLRRRLAILPGAMTR